MSTSEFRTRVNDRDFDGVTPLHLAAARGHAHLVTWLVDHGAKFLLDRMGGTALHFAAANGKLEVGFSSVHAPVFTALDTDGVN